MNKLRAGKICIAVLVVFAVSAAFVAGNIWVSYHLLTVREYDYAVEKITEEITEELSGEIRIVVLSDLHNHQFGKSNEKLIKKVTEQQPDLIFLDGDLLNEDSLNAEIPCKLIQSLKETAPVYAALGNHEIFYMEKNPDLILELEAAGAVVLDKEFVDVNVKGMSLRLGGLYEYAFGLNGENQAQAAPQGTKDFLEKFQDTEQLKIMLSHRPDSFIFGDASKVWNIDLVISGHNHGGQVVLPFLGGLYGGDQGWFPKYAAGIEKKDNIAIFSTRGLGSNGQMLPRFNNPPEIAVFTIIVP